MRSKISSALISLILVFLLVKQPINIISTNPEVQSVSHSPTIVLHLSNVTVTIVFVDDINITGVQIQYCSIEPVFACHLGYYPMIEVSTNTWSGSFEVQEEEGVIGYKLIIHHTEGEIIAPNTTNYLGYDNIMEPLTGQFYFGINLTTPTSEGQICFGWSCTAFVFSAFIIISIIRIRKRNV